MHKRRAMPAAEKLCPCVGWDLVLLCNGVAVWRFHSDCLLLMLRKRKLCVELLVIDGLLRQRNLHNGRCFHPVHKSHRRLVNEWFELRALGFRRSASLCSWRCLRLGYRLQSLLRRGCFDAKHSRGDCHRRRFGLPQQRKVPAERLGD